MQKMREDIVKKMLVTPVTVFPPEATDSLGDAETPEPISYKGYLYENNKKVLNSVGVEVLSGAQIYLQGKDANAIDVLSRVTCEKYIQSPILSKEVFRGKRGSLVIGVLYLP